LHQRLVEVADLAAGGVVGHGESPGEVGVGRRGDCRQEGHVLLKSQRLAPAPIISAAM
jgi:hypothetical protein